MKLHVVKLHLQPLIRSGQPLGCCGVRHGGLAGQQLHQPLGGARRTQQVPVDLAQHGHGAGQQNDIHHGLAQVARAHLSGQHGLCAPVQPPEQQRCVRNDDEGHEQGACLGAIDRRAKCVFGGPRKPRGLAWLSGIALHHRDGVEHFGRDGTGVRHAVLAVA